MNQQTTISNDQLQQLITNAVRSALTGGGGIESNTTEAVSTAPSSLTALLSKKACDRRLKNLKVKRH